MPRNHGCQTSFLSLVAGLVALCLGLGTASAAAQEFDVPEGFTSTWKSETQRTDEWRHLFTVTPVEGAFSELSTIQLREITVAIDDADGWLKGQMSGDFGDFGAGDGLFTSPDSPFGDPAFDALREAIPELIEKLQAIAELPLKFCEGPQTGYNAAGEFRELYCAFVLGPVRQYLVLRVQHAGGRWFFTEIRTMNERRLRHLLAIANSFNMGG